MAIVDLSHHQAPANINYDVFAKQLDFAIIRTQYGSATIDRHYKTHYEELRKRGVVTHAYAWVRGVNIADMEKEAKDFYDRTKDINPYFWWLDIEEKSMSDMRSGIKAFVAKLRSLGVQRIGAYIAHNLYKDFNIDTADFDAVWIPRYGDNNGHPSIKPDYPCDLWQYTSKGRLDGYSRDLDLNQIISDKPLSFFVGETFQQPEAQTAAPVHTVGEHVIFSTCYRSAHDPITSAIPVSKMSRNHGVITKVLSGSPNPYLLDNGYCWVNDGDIRGAYAAPQSTVAIYTVKKGDTLWEIAKRQLGSGSRYKEIMTLNGLKSDTIKPGQKLKISK